MAKLIPAVLRVLTVNESGKNIKFMDETTYIMYSVPQVIKEIEDENPRFGGYEVVYAENGPYIRSKPGTPNLE